MDGQFHLPPRNVENLRHDMYLTKQKAIENIHGMIVLPWLHLEYGTPKCLEIFECFRHGTLGSWDPFLPRNRRGAPGLYEPMHARLDRIYP
jgi:hypothetical protein